MARRKYTGDKTVPKKLINKGYELVNDAIKDYHIFRDKNISVKNKLRYASRRAGHYGKTVKEIYRHGRYIKRHFH